MTKITNNLLFFILIIGTTIGCAPRNVKNECALDRLPRLIFLEKTVGNRTTIAILDLTSVVPYAIPDAELEVVLAEHVSFVSNTITKNVQIVAQYTASDSISLTETKGNVHADVNECISHTWNLAKTDTIRVNGLTMQAGMSGGRVLGNQR